MSSNDRRWDPLSPPALAPAQAPRSLHLTMRDGVKIAIDVYGAAVTRAPAMIRQTRYLRSLDARAGFVAPLFDLYARTRRAFLAAGYVWIDVDVRGTGASTGAWACPWSPAEVADGREIVEWIVAQPWSNGRVGSLGVSYDGTSAEMLATTGHPAVRAVAPLFSLYDVYADVAYPGGIHAKWFTSAWHAYNHALDQNEWARAAAGTLYWIGRAGRASPAPRGLERIFAPGAIDRAAWDARVAPMLSALARGVRPIAGADLNEAVRAHEANLDVDTSASALEVRDRIGLSPFYPELTIDAFSPHTFAKEARDAGVATYSVSGWRDGAYQESAIKRFRTVQNAGSRLLLGPWVHSGKLRIVPFDVAVPTSFDFDAELLAFFGAHLNGAPSERVQNEPPVRYYTMVEERWKEAASWPPRATERALYLGRDRALSDERSDGSTVIHETGESGTGERSRWRSLLSLVPGDYPDRRAKDERATWWQTPPLERGVEVTGHPSIALHLSWDDADDGHVFVYLEDVAPDGRVAYVTEGQLRAQFRSSPRLACGSRSFTRGDLRPIIAREEITIELELLSISWLFRRGHHIRVVITGADRDHFTVLSPRTFRVYASSKLTLPVIE
jgi:putative CocE/NonD family hydrolase